jgi:Arc/MetJ-type ribon-helix-helix transcriptional regulator
MNGRGASDLLRRAVRALLEHRTTREAWKFFLMLRRVKALRMYVP